MEHLCKLRNNLKKLIRTKRKWWTMVNALSHTSEAKAKRLAYSNRFHVGRKKLKWKKKNKEKKITTRISCETNRKNNKNRLNIMSTAWCFKILNNVIDYYDFFFAFLCSFWFIFKHFATLTGIHSCINELINKNHD